MTLQEITGQESGVEILGNIGEIGSIAIINNWSSDYSEYPDVRGQKLSGRAVAKLLKQVEVRNDGSDPSAPDELIAGKCPAMRYDLPDRIVLAPEGWC